MSPKFISVNSAEHHINMSIPDRIKDSADSDYLILYIIKGRLTINSLNGIYSLDSGNLLFLPRREIINIQNSSGETVEFELLFISGEAAELFCNNQTQPQICRLPERSSIPELFSQLRYLCGSVLPRDRAIAQKLALNLLSEIIFLQSETEASSPLLPHVSAVQKLFHDNPGNSYSLNELAAVTHTNKYKLMKDFKEQLKISPMQYLLDLRLSTAKNLLLSTNLSIAHISERVGFSSANYFVHIFKKKTGQSPTEFRHR